MSIGFTELLLVLILIIAWVKPEKLNDYSKQAAKAAKKIVKMRAEMDKEIVQPITEPLAEVASSVKEVKEEMTATIIDVKADLSNGGNE